MNSIGFKPSRQLSTITRVLPLMMALTGLAPHSAAQDNEVENAPEVAGFWGQVTGKVKSAQADGGGFVLVISKAEVDPEKSVLKEGTALLEKELTIGVRIPKYATGIASRHPDDVAFIKTLKPGMVITVKIFAPRANPRVSRIQGPGETERGVPPPNEKNPAPGSAGSKFTITFPDLPPTFYRLDTEEKIPTQMTVFLPTNYDPGRKHPLLIFLDGGNGGGATNPKVARALSEERDFVCAILPLFKEKLIPKQPAGDGKNIPRILMHPEEAPYMWPIFTKMLTKLDTVVPNLDPQRQIIGGFSNGAHTIAAMISDPDCELSRRFSAFLLVEGGGRLEHLGRIKGKAILMVWGNERSRPRAQDNCDAALVAGARASFHIMGDVGHDFPIKEYPAVQGWLRGPAMEAAY